MTPDVKALWDDLARRHRLDPRNRTSSAFQAFNRIADDLARTLTDIETRCSTLREPGDAEDQARRFTGAKPVCAECGTANLEHFCTSKRDGWTLCAACHQRRTCETREEVR